MPSEAAASAQRCATKSTAVDQSEQVVRISLRGPGHDTGRHQPLPNHGAIVVSIDDANLDCRSLPTERDVDCERSERLSSADADATAD